ncbi:MAG: ABC transporter ATP-binding protein [Clostridiales bacterium]|nr:ABC transporter ATP-binding protein [Clostridiales bacterium]
MRIQVLGLKKEYDGVKVLDIDQLSFAEGALHVVMGPNGSGKSTLLEIIAGLTRPDGGSVLYGDRQKDFEAVRRNITLVMQRSYLFQTSVYNNIAMGLKYRGLDREELKDRVLKCAEALDIKRFLHRNVRTLSGGEKQRVALARALALEPDLLLLDESTANLDPESIIIIERVLRDYQRDAGATIIFVTHNVFQAKRLADRAYLLMRGRIIEEGESKEFFENPGSNLTKGFLGGEIVY